jgi:hypothetical protein
MVPIVNIPKHMQFMAPQASPQCSRRDTVSPDISETRTYESQSASSRSEHMAATAAPVARSSSLASTAKGHMMISESPQNLTMSPPCADITWMIIVKYSLTQLELLNMKESKTVYLMCSFNSSADKRVASCVNPDMSANSMKANTPSEKGSKVDLAVD